MSLIEWRPALSVGSHELDEQHRSIFSLLNELHEAALGGAGRDRISPTLTSLVEHLGVHFATEERLMRECGYPGYPTHKAEHDAFADEVKSLLHQQHSEHAVMTGELLRLIRSWLDDHVHRSDRLYVPWLRRMRGAPAT